MKFLKNRKFILFLILITTWTCVLFVLPDFVIYPTQGFKGFLYVTGHFAMICLPVFLCLYLVSLNKYVFTIIFPILVLVGSIMGFYSFFYKAVLTPMILDATLNNDFGTSLDVMPVRLFVFVFANLFASVLAIIFRFKKIEIEKTWVHFIIVFILSTFTLSVSGRATTSFYQHFPLSIYYNFTQYSKMYAKHSQERFQPDSIIDYKSSEKLTVVFVIGETLRADHLSLNGYKRETNPLLSQRKNLVSFPNIFTEYTYTNPSVAHIMTWADSLNKERAYSETSFIPLFKSSGFYTSWIANQEPAKSYISFLLECDTTIYANPQKSVYAYSQWLDGDLLPHFDFINKKDTDNKLIIMHTIGSHWFYNNHYSKEFEKFTPIAKSKIVTQNSTEALINSYDNTVLYTDSFLDSVISKLTNKNAIMIFLSDHGEALGEDGTWLHAGSSKALTNPACIIWCSDKFIEKYPNKFQSLKINKNKRFRTDFLFHSILSAGHIPSKVIESQYDIFSFQEN